jgi:hypothetical protein
MLFILSMKKKRSLSAVQFAPLCVKRASAFFARQLFQPADTDCHRKITKTQAKTFSAEHFL